MVARVLGRSEEAVTLQRQRLSIRAPDQPGWNDQEIRLLGKRPDREVARLIGRTPDAVATKRLKLGIKAWGARPTKARPADPEKTRLRFGPYHPPRTRRGAFLTCELRGKVKVAGYSDGPIPWPMKWKTKSLILCGDLLRAVHEESALAVGQHWDVCVTTVTKWRKALDVGPITEGTRQIKSYATTEAMTPALRAHIAAQKIGKPVNLSPEGRARLMAALRRPKSERWRKSMAPHFAARKGIPVNPQDRAWTPKENQLIGTRPDREVARLVGRSPQAVSARRWVKGIEYVNPRFKPWKPNELKMLGQVPDAQIVSQTRHSLKSVQSKRRKLGLLVRPHPPSWTAREDRLLGKKPDTELARLFGRNRSEVRLRRVQLGIPTSGIHPHYAYWKPHEDKLLGTDTDKAVAEKLGRDKFCVQARRLRLGIPSFRATAKLRSKTT